MPPSPVIVWFNNDLRLADHPALTEAARTGHPVLPVYVWCPEEAAPWEPGSASRWWLGHSLAALAERMAAKGSGLLFAEGPARSVLPRLAKEYGAAAVFWNRSYEPGAGAREAAIARTLHGAGIQSRQFNGSLLHLPSDIQPIGGGHYRVFTPFWKRCVQEPEPGMPLAEPSIIQTPAAWRAAAERSAAPRRSAPGAEFDTCWRPGEVGAGQMLTRFCEAAMEDYAQGRDLPAEPGTSRLSPHLHFGELSPRTVWHAVTQYTAAQGGAGEMGPHAYLRQIYWREFSMHLLYHEPHTPEAPLYPRYANFPWREEPAALERWKAGQTGFPYVDAGMRELRATGWMHNRVRMAAASFLVKDLLLSWEEGARWFWERLADADLANNTMGWQWVAGCGADASPYHRVFNPLTQSKKFDPEGRYLRRWVPELAQLPDRWLHEPVKAPSTILAAAGVRIGDTYPQPMVDHAQARARALKTHHAVMQG